MESWFTLILSYEVLTTDGCPRSLEEQCLLQLKVNLDDVQTKDVPAISASILQNKFAETLNANL